MATRHVNLRLPSSGKFQLGTMALDVDASLYIPRVLQETGFTEWEVDTIATFMALQHEVPEGDFFDIGANVGVFSWLAARFGRLGATAFEPTPSIAETIRSIAKANQLEIDVEEIALASKNGTATFYLSSRSDCSSSLASGFRAAADTVEVPVETLDSYCERTGKRPTLLKIDTETTEPDVLAGARSYIEKHRPWMIVEVLAAQTEAAIAEFFEPLGYHWYQITHEPELLPRKEIFGCRAYKFPNWLFAPEEPASTLWERKRSWRKSAVAATARRPIDASALAYGPDIGKRWRPTDWANFKATVERGYARIAASNGADERVQFFHGDRGFEEVAPPEQSVSVKGGQPHLVEVELLRAGGDMPRIHLALMEYDRDERVNSQRMFLAEGTNTLSFETQPGTSSIRVAFRVAGSGEARLGRVKLFEL